MDDGLKILVVLVGIVVGAFVFVRALRHEDNARVTSGRGVLSLGYASRTGWVMAIAGALIVWFLLTR